MAETFSCLSPNFQDIDKNTQENKVVLHMGLVSSSDCQKWIIVETD